MKYLNSKWVLLVSLLAYIPIDYENIFGGMEMLAKQASFAVRILFGSLGFAIVANLAAKGIERKYISLFTIPLALFLIFNLSSLVNFNFTVAGLGKELAVLGYYYYLSFLLIHATTPYDILDKIRFSLRLIFLLNFLFFLIVPTIGVFGLVGDESMLKGILVNRNSIVLYVVPLIVLEEIFAKTSKASQYVYIVGGLVMLYLTGSDTASVVILAYLSFKFVPLRSAASLLGTATVLLFLNVFITAVNLKSGFVTHIVAKYLKSDPQFSGRTDIWNVSYDLFFNKPIIGHGEGSTAIAEKLGYVIATNGHPINDSFNGLLSIMFESGLIGLACFIAIQYFILLKVREITKIDGKMHFLGFFFLAFYVISVSESIFQYSFFIFWIFVFITHAIAIYGTEEQEQSVTVFRTDQNNKKLSLELGDQEILRS